MEAAISENERPVQVSRILFVFYTVFLALSYGEVVSTRPQY
jgi:hypothetical protein